MKRFLHFSLVMVFAGVLAFAQGPANVRTNLPNNILDPSSQVLLATAEAPLVLPPAPMQHMKNLIRAQINRAIDGRPYQSVSEWKPLTSREKFDVFLHTTYSPRTFANAAIDEAASRARGHHLNPEYERGMMGAAQAYGINLATNETDVFFQRFLFPTVLKQDPRYFRNPDLPFFQRALYAMSRVLITRTDSGGQTFNSSRILSLAASQEVADLYVPGERQGMHPVIGCVGFTLLRDAGENLLHEFWPDVRRKFLHR